MLDRKIILIVDSLSAAEEAALSARPLPDDLGKPQFRRMRSDDAKSGYDAEAHTVTLTISSEFPVERWDGTEVLKHDPSAVDTARLDEGISHLYNHNWDTLLGRTNWYKIADKKLKVTSKYGTNKDAQQRERDLADGILPDVSLGYQILKVEVTEDKTGSRTYNVVRWMPYEWSSVTVPADYTVGLNRSAMHVPDVEVHFRKLADSPTDTVSPPAEQTRSADDPDDPDTEDGDLDEEERKQRSAPAETTSQSTPTQERAITMPEETTTATVGQDLVTQERARVQGLQNLRTIHGTQYSERQLNEDISSGKAVANAMNEVAERVITAAQNSNVRSAADQVVSGMSAKEQRMYSRAGAARASINQLRAGTFTDSEAGFAAEVSDSIRKEATERGFTGLGNGILTPGVTNQRFAQMELQKRTVMSGSGSIAGATNFTTVELPPIEMLRNRAVTMRLGARMVPGLHGTPQFTRQNAAAASSWLAEGVAATSSDPSLNFFQMNPHRLSMGSAYTRDFLALSNLAIDSFLAEDRYEVLALSLDYAALAGSGTNNVPLGLQNYTGLTTVLTGSTRANNGTITPGAGGTQPTYVDLNAVESAISGANADILGVPRWAGTPQARAMMRSILKFPGVNGSDALMPDSKMGADGLQEGPLGYDGVFSNQLPKNGTVNSVPNLHALIFGIWSQMLIGDWDLNEIIADNITGASQAIYKIWEHGYYDINFRHIEAFVWTWVLAQ